jgi:signal transduction histidine kinase
MCKGMRLSASGDFEYDVKMVTRNIDERKKQTLSQYENILRQSQEQAHINAAKLRYISCIVHDLKTPLQSFCFSLDLLQQTPMLNEQRELVQQANVAVDLMKLTISQTMDISKALSGDKIVPRCTTVLLSSVIQRVQVIMYVAIDVLICVQAYAIDLSCCWCMCQPRLRQAGADHLRGGTGRVRCGDHGRGVVVADASEPADQCVQVHGPRQHPR